MDNILLKTERLTVRRFREDDLGPLFQLLGSPEIMRFLEPAFTIEKTERFLREYGLCEMPKIYAADYGPEMIGYVIFHPYDRTAYETGWVIREEYQGRGFAQELTEALIRESPEEKQDLVIECVPQQAATVHIAEKLGFQYEGKRDGCLIFRYRRKETCTEV